MRFVVCVAVCTCAGSGVVAAGGFAVREQSASLMGSAFAGAAAGIDLSSSFWNPAAFGIAESGFSTQSAYALITASTELNNARTDSPFVTGPASTDIDKVGYLSSTYGAYRINETLVLGASITAPFGLATEADDYRYAGRLHGVAGDMMTLNVSPSLAYEIAPGVHIAGGLQFEYMKFKLWTGSFFPGPTSSIKLEDDLGVGYTAGILLKQAHGSSIGLGFRSSIRHELEGDLNAPGDSAPGAATVETPEMVTLSLVQALGPDVRALGTVEWSNWSRIGEIPVTTATPLGAVQVGLLEANWQDGWFVSGGVEYDHSSVLTVRAGVAWEKSPIQDASQRLSVLPDSNRVWTTIGGSYKYSHATTIDVSYAHIFFDDAHLTRDTLNQAGLMLDADVDNSADIFSFGVRTLW